MTGSYRFPVAGNWKPVTNAVPGFLVMIFSVSIFRRSNSIATQINDTLTAVVSDMIQRRVKSFDKLIVNRCFFDLFL